MILEDRFIEYFAELNFIGLDAQLNSEGAPSKVSITLPKRADINEAMELWDYVNKEPVILKALTRRIIKKKKSVLIFEYGGREYKVIGVSNYKNNQS